MTLSSISTTRIANSVSRGPQLPRSAAHTSVGGPCQTLPSPNAGPTSLRVPTTIAPGTVLEAPGMPMVSDSGGAKGARGLAEPALIAIAAIPIRPSVPALRPAQPRRVHVRHG